MPDPISSLTSYPPNVCIDNDGEDSAPATPLQSTATPPPAIQTLGESEPAETPSGTEGLVRKFSTSTVGSNSAALGASPSSSSPPVPAARFWVTSSSAVPGGGSHRVSASLMKADAATGAFQGSNAEAGTVSVQYGKDNDVQVVGLRDTLAISGAGYGLSSRVMPVWCVLTWAKPTTTAAWAVTSVQAQS